jgi:hypothetical protein
LILTELGTGLAGRPEDLNEVIRRAHPGLRELTETLAILRRQNRIISNFIRDADTVSAAVEPFKEDVAKWAREAEDFSRVQATRSEELGRYWNRLPDFLAELKPTMAQLGRTADAQIPTLGRLQEAAPELERFLIAAQPFARETRGSITALGGAATAGSKAFAESRQEIAELRKLARLAPRLGKPLRQFLQTIDDRRRSTENDPSVKELAPPAPDKTAYKEGQGPTGMEALWNYFLFQTLAVNAHDDLGHLLRIVTIAAGPCAPYSASPTEAEIKQCNSWVGPYQPGVNADEGDPAEAPVGPPGPGGPGASKLRRDSQPGPGDPEAPPVPGQRDLSEPQIELPSEVKDLLKRLEDPIGGAPRPELPGGVPGVDNQNSEDILDYLLSP